MITQNQKNIPILVFPVYAEVNKPSDGHESELNAFKKKAYGRKLGAYWRNPDDLGKKVAISLEKAMKFNNRPGWIRLDDEDELGPAIGTLGESFSELPFESEKIVIPYRDSVLSDWFSDGSKETTWGELFEQIAPMLAEPSTSSQVANKILQFATTENIAECILLNNFEHRFLNRLVQAGYVSQNSARGKTYYTLTQAGLALSNKKAFACA